MAMLADTTDAVIGIDTHTDTHTACLVDSLGRQLGVITVPADLAGCRDLMAWAHRNAPGPRLAWAIEGARSHGLGLTRLLLAHDQLVIEAGRPARASKRPDGKSDPADAARAARDALSAAQLAQPRCDGPGKPSTNPLTVLAALSAHFCNDSGDPDHVDVRANMLAPPSVALSVAPASQEARGMALPQFWEGHLRRR